MEYIKLIGIIIGDFSSIIDFEQNYRVDESDRYNSKKKELENNGYICILANVDSDLEVIR